MKKRYFTGAVLLLALVLALTGCNQDAADGTDTATDSVTTTETPQTEREPVWITVAQNSLTNYKIITNTSSNDFATEIEDFQTEWKTLTGAELTVYSDSEPETEYEIIIGKVDRAESRELYEEVPYTGATVKMYGKKIVVGGYEAEMLSKVLRKIRLVTTEKEDGMFCISDDLDYTVNTSGVDIPKIETEGEFLGLHYCVDTQFEVGFKNVNEDEYNAYFEKLYNEGYKVYIDNISSGNRFTTYTKDDIQVHTSWYPAQSSLKVVFGKGDLPPVSDEATESKVTPSITQMGLEGADLSYPNGAPGMSYVIQLPDGRYIIIDGGVDNANDEKNLLEYLKTNNPNSGKPVIAAWFITHADGDHIKLPSSFLKNYGTEVVVEMAMYSFPDFKNTKIVKTDAQDSMYKMVYNFQQAVRSNNAAAKLVNFHTGQKFNIGAAEIEIIYTQEDFYPNEFPYGNHTSAAFSITLGGKKIMFLGDCEKELCQFIEAVYGNSLKSDILQVSHHGFNGGTLAIYKAIDPDICLWSVEKKRFEEDSRCLGTSSGYEFNAWLRNNSIKVRTHYHSSVTTKILLQG